MRSVAIFDDNEGLPSIPHHEIQPAGLTIMSLWHWDLALDCQGRLLAQSNSRGIINPKQAKYIFWSLELLHDPLQPVRIHLLTGCCQPSVHSKVCQKRISQWGQQCI